MQLFLKYKYYYLIFFFIGCLIYYPMMLNGFVSDDLLFIIDSPDLHAINFSLLFDNIYLNRSVFRFITLLYLSFMYTLFGAQASAYHLVQLLLHIVATGFIFILLTRHFNKIPAFFGALLFLIHPINAEAVLWVSSIQSQILTIAGVGAVLLAQRRQLNEKTLLFISLLFFIVLLTNENGIMYIILALGYRIIFKLSEIKKLILIALIVIGIYFYLRIINGSTNYYIFEYFSIGSISIGERLLHIPVIVSYYLKQIIFPIHLIFLQTWVIKEYMTPLYIGSLTILTALLVFCWKFYLLLKNNKEFCKIYIFYLLWLLVFLIPLLQIIPTNMTVADRWFYLPFPGLIGVVIITAKKITLNRYRQLLLLVMLVIIFLFAYRTHLRTYDWRNELTLIQHDIKAQPDSELLNYNLAQLYIENGKYKEAIPHLEKTIQASQKYIYYYFLGESYRQTGQFGKAMIMYNNAIQKMEGMPQKEKIIEPYVFLAELYLHLKQPHQVVTILSDTVLNTPTSIPIMFLLRASAEVELGNYDNALRYATFAKVHAPSSITENFYIYLQDRITKEKNEK